LGQMVAAYQQKTGSDFGLERIDGAAAKATELLAALRAAPFLASSRLVVVEGAAANKAVGAKLGEMLGAVPESTVAVFVERQVDQRTVAFRELNKADKVVRFEPLSGPKLTMWVRAEIGRLGSTAEAAAVRELVGIAGEDQWRLSEEINKLVNYAPEVTVESVRELVAPSTERSIFDLVEAMTAGRTAEALRAYRVLLMHKESDIYVLTMIQWQLRNLLLAKSAPPAMSPTDLAKEVGISPYAAGKMAAAQGRISEGALREAYRAAATCEFDIKTGRIKSEAAVEQLIYRVATGARG